jgi:hypothetical protein
MTIRITDKRRISAIQEEFSKMFPYLKIEFFSRLHKMDGASPKRMMKNPSKTIGECRTIHNDGEIIITPNMSVAELEKRFGNIYGLSIQVFRKSGDAWLETTVTDSWTLEKQNQQGEALSNYLKSKEFSDDYQKLT